MNRQTVTTVGDRTEGSAPVPQDTHVVPLSATRRGARLARLLAAVRLEAWGIPPDPACLVVAELAANAALHARVPGRNFLLGLSVTASGTLLIEVTDTRGDELPVRARGTVADGHPPSPATGCCWYRNWPTAGACAAGRCRGKRYGRNSIAPPVTVQPEPGITSSDGVRARSRPSRARVTAAVGRAADLAKGCAPLTARYGRSLAGFGLPCRTSDASGLFDEAPGASVVGLLLGLVLQAMNPGFEPGIPGEGELSPPSGHEGGHGGEVVGVGDVAVPVAIEVDEQLGRVRSDGGAEGLRSAFGHRGNARHCIVFGACCGAHVAALSSFVAGCGGHP
jgi:hypothetical protein